MLGGFLRIDPRTASSACKLCGGRLRARSSTRLSPPSVSRSASRRSTAIGTAQRLNSGAADGAHVDRHVRGDVTVHPRGDLVRANLSYGIAYLEIPPIHRRTNLLLDRGCHVGGGDRAIQPAL